MFCPICGTKVPENAVFCHKCGERTNDQVNPAESLSQKTHFSSQITSSPPNSNLQPQSDPAQETEKELWTGGYSARAMIPATLSTGAASIAAFIAVFFVDFSWLIAIIVTLLWLILGLVLLYRRLNVHYRLTNQRLIHEMGILRRVTDRIEVIDIDDVAFSQSIIQRILNLGTIQISSSDRTHPVISLHAIDDVANVATEIDRARRNERVQRGLHIETV